MPRAELPAFEYLVAELGVNKLPAVNDAKLPETSRSLFERAFAAHEDLVREIEPVDSRGFDGVREYLNRKEQLEEMLNRAAKVLKAMREGYVPTQIPNDHYVGVLPEKIGLDRRILGDRRPLPTETMKRTFSYPIPREASNALQTARKSHFFDAFLISSPDVHTFQRGGGLVPDSAIYGVMKTGGDLRILDSRSPEGKATGVQIENGVALEIVRMEPNNAIIALQRKAA